LDISRQDGKRSLPGDSERGVRFLILAASRAPSVTDRHLCIACRHKQYGAPICQGKRSQFIGILGTEALLLGVKFRYEATVTGYSDAEEPAVILQGGEIIRGDVVVVADGAKSVSRTLLATPGIPPVPRRSSGYSIFRAIVNITPALRGDDLCGREFFSFSFYSLSLFMHELTSSRRAL